MGCRHRKQKLIETEGKKEKRGGFIMAEPALHWNLFICSVDRKSRTRSTMRWIPLKSTLLMSQHVQNHHLFNYFIHFYLWFHLWFFYLLHAESLFYFLGQRKAESCLFSLSYIKITFTAMLWLSRETYSKGFCKIGISPPTWNN